RKSKGFASSLSHGPYRARHDALKPRYADRWPSDRARESARSPLRSSRATAKPKQIKKRPVHETRLFLIDLVAMAKRPEPDPIPNSTVKRFCANGTVS